MSHEYFLWFGPFVYSMHMVEELLFNWRGWARGYLKIPAEWNEFYFFNAVVAFYGAITAIVGWRCPSFALSYASFMLINAIFFHIIPTIKGKRFSPGLLTGVFLLCPIASLVFYGAWEDNVISVEAVVISVIIGFAFMMYPIALQEMKSIRYFNQTE